ncbi:hypothetical protein SLA2020_388330 [Shorea laevis]
MCCHVALHPLKVSFPGAFTVSPYISAVVSCMLRLSMLYADQTISDLLHHFWKTSMDATLGSLPAPHVFASTGLYLVHYMAMAGDHWASWN